MKILNDLNFIYVNSKSDTNNSTLVLPDYGHACTGTIMNII